MATLSGNKIKNTYQSLVKFSDNGNITTSAKQLTDGFGNNSPMFVSTTQVGIGVTPESGLNLHVFGDAKIGSNLTVIGNLVVEGSTTTVGTDTLTVKDPLIVLANNNTSTDAVDIGFYGKYTPSGTTLYSGLFREALTGKYRLFKGLEVEPTTTVNTSGTGYAVASLIANLEGNVTGNLIGSVTGGTFSGTLLSNVVATTQSAGDNSTKVATTAYVDNQVGLYDTLSEVLANGNTTGANIIEVNNTSGGIDLIDNAKIRFGTDNDLQLYHNGSNAILYNDTGNLVIESREADSIININCDDGSGGSAVYIQADGASGAVELNHYGSNKFQTTSTGVSVTGVISGLTDPSAAQDAATKNYVDTQVGANNELSEVLANGNTTGGTDIAVSAGDDITFADDSKAIFGTDGDLEIYHFSTTDQAFISINGELDIRANTLSLKSYVGETMLRASSNGTVRLYYDGVEKLQTTSTGISVTGGGIFSGNVTVNLTTAASAFTAINTGTNNTFSTFSNASDNTYIGLVGNNGVIQSNNDVVLYSGASYTEGYRLDSSQNSTFAGDVTIANGKFLKLVRNSGSLATDAIGITSGTDDVRLLTTGDFNFVNGSLTNLLNISNSGNSTFAGSIDIGTRRAATPSVMGYSSSYKTLILGSTGTDYTTDAVTLAFGVDVSANASGSFNGNGREYIWRNEGSFITPNAANNGYNSILNWTSGGYTHFASRVGIGTNSPDYPLEVESSGANAYVFSENTAAGGASGYRWKTPDSEFSWYSAGGQNNMNLYDYNAGAIRMTIDSSGNVGIGTASPASRFEVYGGSSGVNDIDRYVRFKASNGEKRFDFHMGGTGNASRLDMYSSDGTTKIVQLGTTSYFNSGNVGIGTTSPDLTGFGYNTLTVVGGTTAGYAGVLELGSPTTNANGQNLGIIAFMDGSTRNAQIDVTRASSTSTSNMYFYTNGGSGIVERMRITSGGVVEIGTSTAQSNSILDVRNNGSAIEFGHTNNNDWYYGTLGAYGSAGNPFISFSTFCEQADNRWTTQGSAGNIIMNDNGNLIFQQVTSTNSTGQAAVERMRITSIGTAKFKTQSGGYGYGASYNFHEFNNDFGNQPIAMFWQASGSGSHYGINVHNNDDENDTTSRFFLGQGGSTERIKIYSNGNIENTNNSYGQLSDIKLKENITDATSKLDDLMQVQIKNFNYIGDEKKQIGVIAQELEEIFPALIYETQKTEYKKVDKTDEEGNIIYETEEVLISEAVEGQELIEWEDKPTIDNTKSEIQTWLDNNNIEWQSADTKQELLDKIPEYKQEAIEAQDAVYETRETDIPETVNKELPTGDPIKGVKYSVLVPIMIKAMQEQQQIINDLKSRIETLENN